MDQQTAVTDDNGAGEQSLREQLEAAVAEHTKPAEAEAAAAQEVETSATDSGRDEKGRFAAAQVEQQQAESADKADTKKAEQAAATAEATQQTSSQATAPSSWNADARAHWEKIPPEVQAYISTREQQMHQQLSRMDGERQVGRDLTQALKPFEHTIKQFNVSPVQAAQHLFAADAALRYGNPDQKIAMVHQILNDYSIPMEAVSQYQPQQIDPAIASLNQRMQQFEQAQLAAVQQQQQAQQDQFQTKIGEFAVKNQHFEQVRGHMAALLQSGLASDLQDAYDQAVWARPDLRQALLSQREAEQRAASQEAASKKVQQAQSAGVSLSGSPGGISPAAADPNRSLRDELTVQLNAAMGRI